jgi:hypothetical protein
MAKDEHYVIDLCDIVLRSPAIRQHKFPFLVGDCGKNGHCQRLPVDAYYEDLCLVIEYRERQHSEPVHIMDRRQTISGCSRGEQRKRYDQRRREVLPMNGITLIELDYAMFSHNNSSKRLIRDAADDEKIIRSKLRRFLNQSKSESSREIAQFLAKGGVDSNRKRVFRLLQKQGESYLEKPQIFTVPTAERYKKALEAIEPNITKEQRQMLEFHYNAHNRTVTFSDLAHAAGYDNHRAANLAYGKLGKLLGDTLKMNFVSSGREKDFFSSAIGLGTHYREEDTGHFQLMMHHELAKSLEQLGWFRDHQRATHQP